MSWQDFLIPNVGIGFIHVIFFLLNIALILFDIVFMPCLLTLLWRRLSGRNTGKLEPKQLKGRDLTAGVSVFTALSVFMVGLCVFAAGDTVEAVSSMESFGLADLFRLALSVLDPVLDIRHLTSSPSSHFFGWNLFVRLAEVVALSLTAWGAVWLARWAACDFSRFLWKKGSALGARLQDKGSRKEEPAGPERKEEPAGPEREGKEPEKNDGERAWDLLRGLAKLIPPGCGITLLLYILGEAETKESITTVLDAVEGFLKFITPLSQVTAGGGSAAVLVSNFFYVLASILVMGVYLAVILMLFTALYTVLKNWSKVVEWLEERKKAILTATGVTALLAAACAGVMGIAYVVQNNSAVLQKGPLDVLGAVGYFLLLVLALCVALAALIFMLAFAVLAAAFAFCAGRAKVNQWKGNRERLIHVAGWVMPTIAGALVFASLVLEYGEIRTYLAGIFSADAQYLQVLAQGAAFLGLLAAAMAVAAVAVAMTVLALCSVVELVTSHRKQVAHRLGGLLRELLMGLAELLSLIPFSLKRGVGILKYFVAAILQIFIGYRNESEKNKAIFVAACFASLASLLNTYFGLSRFYNASGSPVLIVCSFAIACAVQLAMLVFGMKAGEGLAERQMKDCAQADRGVLYAAIKKTFQAAVFLVADVSMVVFAALWRLQRAAPISWLLFLVLSLGFLGLTCASVLQMVDVVRLWRSWRAERRAAKEAPNQDGAEPAPQTEGDTAPALCRTRRRVPYFWHLGVYLLLMVVSTGFAFNNMFGYYAQGARLQERVYDQVRYEADKVLGLEQTVADLVGRYEENTRTLLQELTDRTGKVNKVRQFREKEFRNQADSSGLPEDGNAMERYIGQTGDFEQVVSMLQTFLEMDYDTLGTNVLIVREEYFHFYGGNSQPSYESACLLIYAEGKEEEGKAVVVGTQVPEQGIDTVTLRSGEVVNLPDGRYADPNSTESSVVKTVVRLKEEDKYTVLKELFNIYDRLEDRIYNYGKDESQSNPAQTTPDMTPPSGSMSLTANVLLTENASIDGIRDSVTALHAKFKGGDLDDEMEAVSMAELPRIVNEYLNGSAGQGAEGGSPSDYGSSYDSAAAYEELSDHIDRALALYQVLRLFRNGSPTEPGQAGGGTEEADGGTEEADGDPAYRVRQFRNYAQGITYLNFQISYDTLLCGSLGLNPTRDGRGGGINALYASTAVAVFILIICLIVDFLAFFSGLFLFKEVYLFGRNAKICDMGYLNLDMVLSNLFAVPEGEREQELQLALLYTILYGGLSAGEEGPATGEGEEPAAGEGEEPAAGEEGSWPKTRMSRIVCSSDFVRYRRQMTSVLTQLGLGPDRGGESVDLQNWVHGFVLQHGIRFDELFVMDGEGYRQ